MNKLSLALITVPWQIVRYYQTEEHVCIFISLECWCLTLSIYINFSYPSIMFWTQLQSVLASTAMSFIFLLHKQRAQLRYFVCFRDIFFLLSFFPNKDFLLTFTPQSTKRNKRKAMQRGARKPIGVIGSCSYQICKRHQKLCFKSMICLLIHLKLLNAVSWENLLTEGKFYLCAMGQDETCALLVASKSTVSIWQTQTNNMMFTFENHPK